MSVYQHFDRTDTEIVNTTITVDLPEDSASHLAAGRDLSRMTLEVLALESY